MTVDFAFGDLTGIRNSAALFTICVGGLALGEIIIPNASAGSSGLKDAMTHSWCGGASFGLATTDDPSTSSGGPSDGSTSVDLNWGETEGDRTCTGRAGWSESDVF